MIAEGQFRMRKPGEGAAIKRIGKSLAVQVDEGRALAEARLQLDDDEYERLLTLPASARTLALARMEQVMAWIRAGGDQCDAAAHAARAGTNPSRFYRMVKAWTTTRSIEALGAAVATMAPRRSALVGEIRSSIEFEMESYRREQPDATIEDIVTHAMTLDLPRVPGRTTLHAWAKALKASDECRIFGQISMAIIPFAAELDDDVQHEAALVVDRGSRLILGAGVATNAVSFDAYDRAAWDAVSRISEFQLRGMRPVKGLIDLQLVEYVEPDLVPQVLAAIARRDRLYTHVDGAPAVRMIRRSIGERLGHLKMGKGPLPWRREKGGLRTEAPRRSTGDIETAPDWPRLTINDFAWVLARAIDRHNDKVLSAAGAGREGSAMRSVRTRVRDVLNEMRKEER